MKASFTAPSADVGIGGQAHESYRTLPTSEISSSISFAVLIVSFAIICPTPCFALLCFALAFALCIACLASRPITLLLNMHPPFPPFLAPPPANTQLTQRKYLNVFFSLTYLLGNCAVITEKLLHFRFTSNLQEVLLLPCFVIWVAGEMARFYFAYIGNLKERVPQMSAFLLMTIFPQLPCVIFLGFYQELLFPFDLSTGVVMLTMLIVELLVGYMTLHTLIQRQTAQFYRLCQEEEEDNRSKIVS